MFDQMTNAEADRKSLHQQLEDLKVKCVNNKVDVPFEDGCCNCQRCAPAAPGLFWKKVDRKVKVVED
jgi:hypothetical protein